MAPEIISEARQSAALRRAGLRILPWVFLLYIISYLDRANVGFAKSAMSSDLKFSESIFWRGTGIFYLGYFLLEIPGAIIAERWSARKWLARILITWGFCTIFVGLVFTPVQFYSARFFLGLAEAGFFPAILVYLTHWFTARERARAMSWLVIGIPAAMMIGSRLSAWMLKLSWLDLPGWRWLFILQGLPAIVCGVITLAWLSDYPRQARWLGAAEKEWMEKRLEEERARKRTASGSMSAGRGLRDPRVIALAAALFFVNIGMYALTIWLPDLLKKAGKLTDSEAANYTFVPFAAAFVSVLLSGWSSDRFRERKWHTVFPMLGVGCFFYASAMQGLSFPWVLALLTLAVGIGYAWPSAFWVLPTLTLGETAAAASLGLINSIGNLGGFAAGEIIGWLKRNEWIDASIIHILCGCFGISALLVLGIFATARGRLREADIPADRSPRVQESPAGLADLKVE